MHKSSRLIVFFIPPEEIINGGVLSIFSICKVSREFYDIHKSKVVLSVYPGYKSYGKNKLFDNDETIFAFDDIVKNGSPSFLQLHVPEYAAFEVFTRLNRHQKFLNGVAELSVNIMNQNIMMMGSPEEVSEWFSITPKLSQTTAHDKYSNQQLANDYNLPTHHLSVFNDQSQYQWVPYEKKEDIILLSPDEAPQKNAIVRKLKANFPSYKIITVKDMHYEAYKKIMARARFTVTFGEGFDGYYIESFFSGGVTFAVYNEDFFPGEGFADFSNTYQCYDDMAKNLTNDMKRLGQKPSYEKVVECNLVEIKKLYDYAKYKENLKNFYLNKFSFYPEKYSAEHLIGRVLASKNKIIKEKDAMVVDKDRLLQKKDAMIADKDQFIQQLLNSTSWKVTQPLRKVSYIVRVKPKKNK